MIAILTIFYEKVRDIAKCITNNEDIDIEQKITDVSNVIREEYYSYQHRDLESAQQTQEDQHHQDQDLERALDPDHHIITIRDEDESSSQDELYFNPATISSLRRQHEVPRCTFFELHKPASSLEEANKSIDTLYNILDNEIEAHEITAYRMKLLWNKLYGTDQNV